MGKAAAGGGLAVVVVVCVPGAARGGELIRRDVVPETVVQALSCQSLLLIEGKNLKRSCSAAQRGLTLLVRFCCYSGASP